MIAADDPFLQFFDAQIASLKAQLSALEEAKPAIVIGPISDEQRVAAIEALLARQHAGFAAPGDAEKIRTIERLIERGRREAPPRRAASVRVSQMEPSTSEPVSEAPMEHRHRGVSYHAIDHGPEPALKPECIDSPPASSAGPWSASRLWPPPVPQQLQIPSHEFERSGRRRSRWPSGQP